MFGIRSVFSMLVLEALTFCSLSAMAAESTVFGFKLADGLKQMTLVKTDRAGVYRYRFGTQTLVELEFPKGDILASKAFELDTQSRVPGVPRLTLSFRNGEFRYSIYEEFNEINKPIAVGIIVKNMKTRVEKEFQGDRKSIQGGLASLKDDPIIPKISAPQPLDTVKHRTCRISLQEWEGEGLFPRVTKWQLTSAVIRNGLPPKLMQTLNMELKKHFDRALAQDKLEFKNGEAVYVNKDCDAVADHEFHSLIAGKKLDEVRVTDESGASIEMLGTKIIVLSERYYYESTGRMDAGAKNLSFYRIADGKEIPRQQLFTKTGLAIIDREVRSRLNCNRLKDIDPSEHYNHPCQRFKSVLDHGYFYSKGHQVHLGFSRGEISEFGDEGAFFEGSEFDSFLH